jgi:DNA ligase-1
MLNNLNNFVLESNSTNSNTDKLNVLRKYAHDAEIVKALIYTYDAFRQYYVTSANCKKRNDLVAPFSVYDNLFSMLDDLAERRITGHSAIEAVNRFVLDNKEYEDLIWCVIDRNLKTRSTTQMINKVLAEFGLEGIPTFDVALAEAYDEKTAKKVDFKDGWFMSRKLDGVRCICIMKKNGEVNFYSRVGNEFETLGNLKAELSRMPQDLVLDGEICMVDENGKEDFQGIIKEIKRKNHTIKRPKFLVFDALTHTEFFEKSSGRKFSQRQEFLEGWFENYSSELFLTDKLEQIRVQNQDHMNEFIAQGSKEGWEGIMLRKDSYYKGKRSSDILKVKQFHDAEYNVIAVENGPFRVIVDGKEVEEDMMRHVIIEHKGYRVDVGSGFSLEQRRHFYQNPDLIIGKQITVQYFEETHNQHGQISLRFPTVKAIYETIRTF